MADELFKNDSEKNNISENEINTNSEDETVEVNETTEQESNVKENESLITSEQSNEMIEYYTDEGNTEPDEIIEMVTVQQLKEAEQRKLDANLKEAESTDGNKKGKKEAKNNIERTDIKFLPCDLTEKELKQYSNEMAIKYQQLKEEEEKKKTIVSEFNSKIKTMNSRLEELSRLVKDKVVHRDVAITIKYDFVKGEKEIYRNDTGEFVQVDEIPDHERQLRFQW